MNKILILLLNRFLKLQGINTNTHLNRLKMAISCNPLATKEITNMAIDGTDILESDLGIDVQNEILDRYDSGQSVDEIKSYLKNL